VRMQKVSCGREEGLVGVDDAETHTHSSFLTATWVT
jgi:hypothetical protein